MAEPDPGPNVILARLRRRRKRLRVIRVTFAMTALAAVGLMFVASFWQGLSPTIRNIDIVLFEAGAKEHPRAWMLDQTLDAPGDHADGAFRLGVLDGKEAAFGRFVQGRAGGMVPLGENRLGVLVEERLIVYDVSGTPGGDGWPKLVEHRSLGVNASDARPVAADLNGEAWLCWVEGKEILVRPLDDDSCRPARLDRLSRSGVQLRLEAGDGKLWLAVREIRSGHLRLLQFTPVVRFEDAASAPVGEKPTEDTPPGEDAASGAPEDPPEEARAEKPAEARDEASPARNDAVAVKSEAAEAAPPPRSVVVEGLSSSDVHGNVAASVHAVLQGRPVVALVADGQGSRDWEIWTTDQHGAWTRNDDHPPTGKGLPIAYSYFMSLAVRGDKLAAIYSDGGHVRLSFGEFTPEGALKWSPAEDVPVEKGTGLGPLFLWALLLMAVLALLAGQGIWLLLNRERDLDRTLGALLREGHGETGTGDRAQAAREARLVYANAFARSSALFLDLILTSPLVMMLKSVYRYEWTEAYGFLFLGSVQGDLAQAVQASVVTMTILSIYSMTCEMLWGRTLGKALLHLRVVDLQGEAPSAWRILVRNVLRILELVHWTVMLIPMGLMMATRRQQRLGDLLAGTCVVVDVVADEQPDDADIG